MKEREREKGKLIMTMKAEIRAKLPQAKESPRLPAKHWKLGQRGMDWLLSLAL